MPDTTKTDVDVKAAIKIAKDYISELFASDKIKNIGLEEVSFDELEHSWHITIGFSRPWDEAALSGAAQAATLNMLFPDSANRTYKSVIVEAASGKVLRVSNRPI